MPCSLKQQHQELKYQERNKQNGFPTLEKEVSREKNFTITRFLLKIRSFTWVSHLSCTQDYTWIAPKFNPNWEVFQVFLSMFLQFYNLLERFFQVSSPCSTILQPTWEVFHISSPHSTFSSLPEVFASFPLHNSTSFNLPRDLHFLSTILHSTKKHWDSLNNSTLHNLQWATHTPKLKK